MKSIVVSLALLMTSFAAQATGLANQEACDILKLEEEVETYVNLKLRDGGTRFVGACLEQAIQENIEANTIRGIKVDRNLISEELIVLEIKRDLDHQREAAEIKAEIFEKSFHFPESLEQEADLKRQNPLLDKNGEFRE